MEEILTENDYRFIQIIMTRAAQLGCFRELDEDEAIKLYNKISKIIDNLNDKETKNSISIKNQ